MTSLWPDYFKTKKTNALGHKMALRSKIGQTYSFMIWYFVFLYYYIFYRTIFSWVMINTNIWYTGQTKLYDDNKFGTAWNKEMLSKSIVSLT